MEDRADQERVACFFPMIAPFERALGIDQDVRHVLDVAHLAVAAANFEQRILRGHSRLGWIEHTHPAISDPPTGGQLPVLALDVVDDGRARPGQKRRDDETDAFSRSGRRKAEHMLRSVVPKILATKTTEHDAVWIE